MIALIWDNSRGEADIAQAPDGGVAEGDELATSVLISLFTDRLVDANEVPDGVDRAGWWGDAYPLDGEEGDAIGSRLWLLDGGRASADAPARARAYAIEALRWMLDDGIARSVDAQATLSDGGRLDLEVSITLTDGTVRTYSFPGRRGP